MEKFVEQHGGNVKGVLSGFDRLVFRGSLRMLSFTAGMMGFLSKMGVLLKDFGEYVEGETQRLRAHAKIRLHFRRFDCVVPVRKCSMSREFDLCHLFVRNFHTFFIVFPHKVSLHLQAGFSFCCTNKFQHCLIGI